MSSRQFSQREEEESRKIKCLPRALKNVPTEEDVGNLEVEVNKEHVRDTYAVPSLSVFYGLGKYPVLKGLESTVALLGDGGNFRRGIRQEVLKSVGCSCKKDDRTPVIFLFLVLFPTHEQSALTCIPQHCHLAFILQTQSNGLSNCELETQKPGAQIDLLYVNYLRYSITLSFRIKHNLLIFPCQQCRNVDILYMPLGKLTFISLVYSTIVLFPS